MNCQIQEENVKGPNLSEFDDTPDPQGLLDKRRGQMDVSYGLQKTTQGLALVASRLLI